MLFLYNPGTFMTAHRHPDLVVGPTGAIQCHIRHLDLAAVGFDLPALDAVDVPVRWRWWYLRF